MFKIKDFFQEDECQKTDAHTINAKLELKLDPLNPTGFILENPWGDTGLDIKKLIKAGETITSIKLAPAITPTAIRYEREDGGVDCIEGDNLSKIISMKLLGDVDQAEKPTMGDVYIYGADEKFHPFQLGSVIKKITQNADRDKMMIERLLGEVEDLTKEIERLKELLTKPKGVPENAGVAWGNINVYGDISNANIKDSGIYTHDITEDKTNDLIFS